MSFKDQIAKFNKKAKRKATLKFRGTALSMFSHVILRTPVKSGRLRGNWQSRLNKPASGTLEVNDATGSKAISEAGETVARAKLGDSIFLVNNLPYAQGIEDGNSQQAPSGMVKVTVAEFQTIMKRAS
jgi:hypothetical protein